MRKDDGPRSRPRAAGRYLAPRLAAFFAPVGPVLTAHPKEVRRKSRIDSKLEVAKLLAARGRPFLTAAELRANGTALRRAVLTRWQTNLLRRTRVRVAGGGMALADGLRASAFIWHHSICARTPMRTERALGEIFGLVQPGVDYASLTEPERIHPIG
jgi:phosphoenolpyruvate carboxylase